MFRDRKQEIQTLKGIYRENKPKLIILYGRRRVGKTELLKEFSREHGGIYVVGRQESLHDQLKKISFAFADYFREESLRLSPFDSWDAVFTYLRDRLKNKRVPVFFDEFPFFVQSHPPLPSVLQDYWDNYFSKSNAFFVLCGSSISMMEKLLGYKSPLYGRRTEQILLEPMNFFDACKFFPKEMKMEEKIELYSVLGGTPAYLLEFDFNKPLEENIRKRILEKNKFLYNDVLFVLREELSEPRNYFSILHSIAKGNTKIGNIINDTGLDKGTVIKYLSVLIDLQIIERKVPITEKNPKKSRKGIYLLKDNFFKFWFRFVFENTEYIEQDRQQILIKEKLEPNFNDYVGRCFEDISLGWIKKHKLFSNYIFGKWWDRDIEIDIIGLDKKNKKILFGEVKWRKLSESEAQGIINNLRKKASYVSWQKEDRQETFVLIAKEIEEKKHLEEQGIIVLDAEDVQKEFLL